MYTRTVAPVKFFIKIYIRNSSASKKGGGEAGGAKRSRKDKLADAICENFILLLERKNTGPRLNLILTTQLQVLESETFYVGYNIS